MNTYRNIEDEVHSRAEHWFARMRADGCSVQERREFSAWLAESPANAAAYSHTQQLWDELGNLGNDAEIVRWRESARSRSRAVLTGTPWRRWRIAFGAAASLLFCAVGAYYFSSQFTQAPQRIYQTARGEQSRFTLEDGSHLTLNTDTRLGVRIDRRIREVELLRGEALFEVAHENTRPFRVSAGGNTVTDLGTSFNVRSEADYTQVTLIEGRAQVARDDGKHNDELAPGDQLTAGTTVWKKQAISNLTSITDWTNGRLVFHATPLQEVVVLVNRYGPGRLVIADNSIASIEISGDFRIGNTQALLRALQSAFPIRVQTDTATGDMRLYRRN